MGKLVGQYVRQRRMELGLTIKQVAVLMGRRNINKAMRRISTFEAKGDGPPGLFDELVQILMLDGITIKELLADERAAFLDWLHEPIQPYIVVRLETGFQQRIELGSDCRTTVKAISAARGYARQMNVYACLVLSRYENVSFRPDDGAIYWWASGRNGELVIPSRFIDGRKT